MQIDHNILITYGGVSKKFEKGEIIFWEGTLPHFFYQIVEGEVKLFSTNTDGKELIQGIFKNGNSFGEPPLLLDRHYPSTAQTITPAVIIRIGKERLLDILKDYPEVGAQLLFSLAERLYNKASAVQVWVSHTPEEKIIQFLNNYKRANNTTEKILIPYTRQQIACFTGLRVETVIRTLIRMSKEEKVEITNHKLFY